MTHDGCPTRCPTAATGGACHPGALRITDYEEFLEPVDVDVDIQSRHCEIEVDEETFLALREVAKKEQKPIKELANEILKRRLHAG
jgi:hypothetical protein